MKNQFSLKLLSTCILLAAGSTHAASLVLPEEETVLVFDESPVSQPKPQPKPSVAAPKQVEAPLVLNTNSSNKTGYSTSQTDYQEKLKQANELAQAAKEQAALAQKLKREADQQAKTEAEEQRKAKLEAERQARIKAEEDRKARLEAERQALAQAEADRKAKLEAEKVAKQQAEVIRMNELAKKLENEARVKAEEEKIRKAKEAAEKAQAEAQLKEKLEAERQAKAQAELDRRAKIEADRQARAQAEAARSASKAQSNKPVAPISTQNPSLGTNYNVDAEELARRSVAEKISKQQAQTKMFDSSVSLPSSQNYSKGTTALQRATSSIVTGYAVPQNAPKVQALGFRATDTQVKNFDEKYQYNLSQLTPIPPEIAEIRLAPIAKLNGDRLMLFANQHDRQVVEEYLMYHPHYAKIFSNFVKRAMTLNNGHTGSLSIKDAIINELSFKISGITIPSVMNINTATDTYLYITSRLNEADQVKFWNWINVVRTGSVVDVPSWVRLVDVMYSAN